jgi:hypothetical protein
MCAARFRYFDFDAGFGTTARTLFVAVSGDVPNVSIPTFSEQQVQKDHLSRPTAASSPLKKQYRVFLFSKCYECSAIESSLCVKRL